MAEEHIRQNNQKHLAMTAATSVKMSQKLLEQEEKLPEQEEKLQEQEEKQQEQEEKPQEQEEKLQEQEEKLQEQEEKLQEQEEKLQEQEEKLQEQEEKLQEQEMRFQVLEQKFHKLLQEQEKKFERLEKKSDQNEGALDEVINFILKRRFEMENFSLEKVKDRVKVGDWKSPAMYTHMCGYKFCLCIEANVPDFSYGKVMSVYLYAMQGEHDRLLKWPARVRGTLELLHQYGGQNIIHTLTEVEWQKPTTPYTRIKRFTANVYPLQRTFLQHSELADFLNNDALCFHLSNITVY